LIFPITRATKPSFFFSGADGAGGILAAFFERGENLARLRPSIGKTASAGLRENQAALDDNIELP